MHMGPAIVERQSRMSGNIDKRFNKIILQHSCTPPLWGSPNLLISI